MSKGTWRRMGRKGSRGKYAYDDDAMIWNDEWVNAPVKAGHHGYRGRDHRPWRQGEPSALDPLQSAL